VGDFSDWLITGCHPAAEIAAAPSLAAQASSFLLDEELSWLLTGTFALPRTDGTTAGRPDVFISYASADFAQAAATCRALESHGLVCWIAPRDIDRQALPYPEAIQQNLARVRAVVVLVSEAANASVHVPRELDLALERRLAIIPLRLQDKAPTGQLNYLLRTCQWLNVFGRDFSAAMEDLLARLRSLGSS
jgi:hypothetical protein